MADNNNNMKNSRPGRQLSSAANKVEQELVIVATIWQQLQLSCTKSDKVRA